MKGTLKKQTLNPNVGIFSNNTWVIRNLGLFIMLVFVLASCSEEEPIAPAPIPPVKETISISNFKTILKEKPNNNELLGKVTATTNSEDELFFSIIEEEPSNAVAINSSTGELFIKDSVLFDLKSRSLIEGTIQVTSGDLTETADFTIELRLSDYSLSVIDYFQDIALGFEFGSATPITRRWNNEMRIFVGGSPSLELKEELVKIVGELNQLATSGFSIELVEDTLQSNYYIFFGSGTVYGQIFPNQSGLVDSNWGLFSIYWNGSNELYTGFMYVDIFRASMQEQKHLLREELTQSLGLAKDSPQYPNSIFQSSFSTKTTEYAAIDRDLIRLLYHQEMELGLNASQVEAVLKGIFIQEW